MTPEEREDLLAGYALGTLSGTAADAVEELVRSDAAAAAELAAYHEIVDLIALDVPLRRADPRLRDRVIAAARRGVLPRRRRVPTWRVASVAALAAAFVLTVGWAVRLQSQLSDLQRETSAIAAVVEADAKRVDALVSSNDRDTTVHALQTQLQTIVNNQDVIVAVTTDAQAWNGQLEPQEAAHGATARVVWSHDEHAGLVILSDLPPLPFGQAYQVWLDDGTELVPGPVFTPDGNGDAEVLLQPDLGIDPRAMAVAVSPAAGGVTIQQPVVLWGLIDR